MATLWIKLRAKPLVTFHTNMYCHAKIIIYTSESADFTSAYGITNKRSEQLDNSCEWLLVGVVMNATLMLNQ